MFELVFLIWKLFLKSEKLRRLSFFVWKFSLGVFATWFDIGLKWFSPPPNEEKTDGHADDGWNQLSNEVAKFTTVKESNQIKCCKTTILHEKVEEHPFEGINETLSEISSLFSCFLVFDENDQKHDLANQWNNGTNDQHNTCDQLLSKNIYGQDNVVDSTQNA